MLTTHPHQTCHMQIVTVHAIHNSVELVHNDTLFIPSLGAATQGGRGGDHPPKFKIGGALTPILHKASQLICTGCSHTCTEEVVL